MRSVGIEIACTSWLEATEHSLPSMHSNTQKAFLFHLGKIIIFHSPTNDPSHFPTIHSLCACFATGRNGSLSLSLANFWLSFWHANNHTEWALKNTPLYLNGNAVISWFFPSSRAHVRGSGVCSVKRKGFEWLYKRQGSNKPTRPKWPRTNHPPQRASLHNSP